MEILPVSLARPYPLESSPVLRLSSKGLLREDFSFHLSRKTSLPLQNSRLLDLDGSYNMFHSAEIISTYILIGFMLFHLTSLLTVLWTSLCPVMSVGGQKSPSNHSQWGLCGSPDTAVSP